jgi:hypothetical protein
MSQDIALPKPAMAILREAGVIRHLAVQSEAAEPAIGEVEMDLFTQPPLRTNAHCVTDNQHPHHQFGIDRGTASAAIEWLQLLANAIEFEMTVYPPQQVLGGDVIINAEVIKELRRSCLTSHHRSILRKSIRRLNHGSLVPTTLSFSTVSANSSHYGKGVSLCASVGI